MGNHDFSKSYKHDLSRWKVAQAYQDQGKNSLEDGGTPMDRVFEENVIFDHFLIRKSEKTNIE